MRWFEGLRRIALAGCTFVPVVTGVSSPPTAAEILYQSRGDTIGCVARPAALAQAFPTNPRRRAPDWAKAVSNEGQCALVTPDSRWLLVRHDGPVTLVRSLDSGDQVYIPTMDLAAVTSQRPQPPRAAPGFPIDALADDTGKWEPAGGTAAGITGTIIVSPSLIAFESGKSLPLAASGTAALATDMNRIVTANVYRVTQPDNPVLLNGNRLCGGNQRVAFILLWHARSGDDDLLQMNAFAGPRLAAGSTDDCGRYGYGRAVQPARASVAPLRASRASWQGCEWKRFESAALGVRLLVQDCAAANQHYVFSAKGDWLEMHRPSDDRTFNGPRVLKVFAKPADQPIEEAIRLSVVQQLGPEARESCQVRAAENIDAKGPGKAFYEIVPTGAYEQKIMAELRQGPRDFGCGPYGKGQSQTYFEYHPGETTTKYLFVVYGQDEPLFDENSIEFIH